MLLQGIRCNNQESIQTPSMYFFSNEAILCERLSSSTSLVISAKIGLLGQARGKIMICNAGKTCHDHVFPCGEITQYWHLSGLKQKHFHSVESS